VQNNIILDYIEYFSKETENLRPTAGTQCPRKFIFLRKMH